MRKIGGFRGLYFHYCYCLGLLPKGGELRPLSPELREECRHLDAISRQTQLICREKLDTAENVTPFISEKQAEMRHLMDTRSTAITACAAVMMRMRSQRSRASVTG